MCPSKLDKYEPAKILLNELSERRMYVENVILKIEKDDSGWVLFQLLFLLQNFNSKINLNLNLYRFH